MSNTETATQQVIGSGSQFCTFRLAGRLFGVTIESVKEINTETSFTTLYHAPSEVTGYVNIRGQIHLILDLRVILGFDEIQEEDRASRRLVLFKPLKGEAFGVLVDSIGDVVKVTDEAMEERLAPDDAASDTSGASCLITSTCKLEGELLTILEEKAFLEFVKGKF